MVANRAIVTYAGATCDYKRKEQIASFLLTLFLGEFGAFYFYLGLIGLGCIQLFVPCCGMVCCGAIAAASSKNAPPLAFLAGFLAVASGLAGFGWYWATFALAIMNNTPDSNGVSLKGW